MNGIALTNPAGLQFDFTLKVFLLWFLAWIFLLIAIYGIHTLRYYRRQEQKTTHHKKDVARLQKQLLIQKMQTAGDQELVALFVAYLEKFTTTSGAWSISNVLTWAKFSDNEIAELKVINYGKGKLSEQLKAKIMKRLKEEKK